MFLEIVHAEGLSHLSYIFGDGGKAAVIDPRRDCKIYADIANSRGARITHIFETHCHEDFVSGALELARRTGAEIYHGHALAFRYGTGVREGETFDLGNLSLKVIETPGHTPESICLTLSDRVYSERPVAVFTGDTLFIGDAGRTDLFPAMRDELVEKLYDSLHRKIMPLGDHVIIYPAHGEGSVCAKKPASREFSTLGFERQSNPMLARSRKDFIQHNLWEEHHAPPYFWQMQKFNREGIPLVAKLPEPKPENAENFAAAIDQHGLLVLDVRSPEAFAGAHIPDSLSIPLDRFSLMAGWFLPYDRTIGLVAERAEDAAKARLFLMRMGFDNASMYLAGGMTAWTGAGKSFASIPTVDAEELRRRIAIREDLLVLDVRSRTEYAEIPSDPSQNTWIGDLPRQLNALPRDKKIVAFCSNGQRAIIAASLLQQANFRRVEVYLGSDKAYKALQISKKAA